MWRIEVPGLPPSLNAFYGGMHWAKRKGIVDEWHEIFHFALKEAEVPKKLRTPITIAVTQFCKGRMRDRDNAIIAHKLLADVLKNDGYIPDDSYKYVNSAILDVRKGKENKTVIIIQ